MAVNLCTAHKNTDSCAAQEVLIACFLQSCSTRRWISCSARNRARMLYTKDNSRVTWEFGSSNSTKIQEHTSVAAHEYQLRNELYHRVWQEGTGEKDFPVLCDSRSRYVELHRKFVMRQGRCFRKPRVCD